MLKKLSALFVVIMLATSLFGAVSASATVSPVVLGINGLDVRGSEGHSLIITRKTGMSLPDIGNYFTWWRTALFEYSDEAEAYVVTALSLTASGSAPKQLYIPEDGFVLAVNIGNDYGNINYQNKISRDTYEALDKLHVGDKAYLVGLDLANGYIDKSNKNHWDKDFTSNAKIYINEVPDGVEIYSPERNAPRLDEVKLLLENGSVISGSRDWTLNWEEVEGADYYIVNINDGVSGDIGAAVVGNKKVTETTLTVPVSKLVTGYTYRVAITAVAKDHRASFNTNVKVSAVSDRAVGGPLSDKKIVAFGDSITAFTGWVKMLVGELGTEVINSGVGGNTTNDAVKRLKEDVLDYDPDIVIMMFGMNDQSIILNTGLPIVSLNQYEKNYRYMIERMREKGIDVVLMTGHEVCTDTNYYVAGQYNLDYGTGNIDNYFGVIKALAAEYNLNLIDMTERCEAETRAKMCAMGDGIHLSSYGHSMYAKWISDFFYDEYVERLGFETSTEESVNEEPSEDSSGDLSDVLSEEEPTGLSTEASNHVSDEDDSDSSSLKYFAICGSILLVAGVVTARALRKKKNKTN